MKTKFVASLALFLSPLLTSCAPTEILNSCDSKLPAEQLYEKTLPSVAVINTKTGIGSAFIVQHKNDNTYLLTNSHVTAGNMRVEVIWADKTREEGRVVADLMGQQEADIALVEVKGLRGKPLKIQSTQPSIGNELLAIGAPRGFDFSMTRGIISQLRKDNQLIQIDAPINPGNSGGPTVTTGGCVSGMVTFKRSDSEGINFAIAPSVLTRFLANPTHVRFDDTAVIEKAPPFFVNVDEIMSSIHTFHPRDNAQAQWDANSIKITWDGKKFEYWIDSANVKESGGWKSFNVRKLPIEQWEMPTFSAAVQCTEGLMLFGGSSLIRKMGSEWWLEELADLQEEYEHHLSGRSEHYLSDFALGTLAANSKRMLEKSTGQYPVVDSSMRSIIANTKDLAKKRGNALNPFYKMLCMSKQI